MNIDERLEALARSVELLTHDLHELHKLNEINQDLSGEMRTAVARLKS